jgi:teichuronic acid biosynthesis glycosyltransferase TuaG
MADGHQRALVSVVVPFRNAAPFLGACCRSILKQTYTNWEALLVDDNSSDGSLEIAQEYVTLDPRFRLIRTGRTPGDPAGPWLPRNRGLETAEGAIVAFLDADDIWHAEKLERQLNLMQHTRSDFCVCAYFRFNDSTKLISELRTPPPKIRPSLVALINPIPLSTVVSRRECLGQGFRPVCHEDHDAWRRLFQASTVHYCCVAMPLTAYRIHESNLTGSWWQKLNMRRQFQEQRGSGWRPDHFMLFLLLQVGHQVRSLRWRLSRTSIDTLGFQAHSISLSETILEAYQAYEKMVDASGNEDEP